MSRGDPLQLQSRIDQLTLEAASTTQQMKQYIEEMYRPEIHIKINSIKEPYPDDDDDILDPALALIKVINIAEGSCRILFEFEILRPKRLLPNDEGIECLGQFCCQFRGASHETQLAVKKYDEELAHTRKLLNDLPIALANNEIAFSSYVESIHTEREISYEEVGTMALEHYRIQKEIDQQTSRLKELEAKPIVANPKEFICHRFHTSAIMKFGRNLLDGKVYEVIRIPKSPPIHPVGVMTVHKSLTA